MTRPKPSVDSNILVYAVLEPESEKGLRALQTVALSMRSGAVALQALLEFVAVVRRRTPQSTSQAIAQAEAWAAAFQTAATTDAVAAAAHRLVSQHHFQVWDAVIWSASRLAGATLFFTEDLQDDLTIDGMRAVNPFALGPDELAALLGSSGP